MFSRIIEDNYNASNRSFLYFLHEQNKFDIESLKDLVIEIKNLTKNLSLNTEKHKLIMEYIKKLFKIYQFTTRYILSHFDKNDLKKINNYKEDYYYLYHSRLEFVIQKFFDLDYKAMEKYEDELGTLNDW
jgi:glycerophosphoryl diester phosphodiesterase